MLQNLKDKAKEFHHKHEARLHVGFFLCGFVFDYLAAGEIDEPFMLVQQLGYLLLIGGILSLEHLTESGLVVIGRGSGIWKYRSAILHFCLGTILNLYSLFFFKSASVFTSFVFVIFLLGLIVANELPKVRQSGIGIRWALWVLCLFCFFSVLFPLALGFVGVVPFLLSAVTTILILFLHMRWMARLQKNGREILRAFVQPGFAVVGLFVILYFLHLVPPVPLAVHDMGIYHQLEKREGKYIVSHERPWWKFWETGDQTFLFRTGDQIYFFTKIFSPGRFSDQVIIHWLYDDPRSGWITSDKVRMQVSGGREEGFRGFAVKKNFQPGHWRVQVETTDEREIGRLYVNIIQDTSTDERVWKQREF